MRILSWLISILLHAAVLGVAVWMAQSPPRMIDLSVPVYQVDLVKLAKGRPARAVAKPKAAPKPVAKPAPKPEPKAAPVVTPEVKPEPKPEPKPEAKPVAAEEKKPEKKAEPEKKPEPKPEPKKPEKTKEQILAEAREQAEKDAKWKAFQEQKAREQAERRQREALEKELRDLRQSVAEADADAAESAENGTIGDGGQDDITMTYGLADIYAAQVVAAIRPNWRFPALPGSENLNAKVRIRIAPDGTIREYVVTEPSGRPEFDASVLKAVEETKQLPTPPRPDLEYIVVNFNLSELQL